MSRSGHRGLARASGRVVLPIHIKWSGPVEYDLADEAQRRVVYEVVLREGGADEVRQFIDPDEVLRLWDRLVLPAHVRAAWRDYFILVRGLDPERVEGSHSRTF